MYQVVPYTRYFLNSYFLRVLIQKSLFQATARCTVKKWKNVSNYHIAKSSINIHNPADLLVVSINV